VHQESFPSGFTLTVDEGQRGEAEGPFEEGRGAPWVRERGEGQVLSSVKGGVIPEGAIPRTYEGRMR